MWSSIANGDTQTTYTHTHQRIVHSLTPCGLNDGPNNDLLVKSSLTETCFEQRHWFVSRALKSAVCGRHALGLWQMPYYNAAMWLRSGQSELKNEINVYQTFWKNTITRQACLGGRLCSVCYRWRLANLNDLGHSCDALQRIRCFYRLQANKRAA
jgi:hypothetical protein